MTLKDYLRVKKIKQKDITLGTGVRQSALSAYLKGYGGLNMKAIERISKYLDIPLSQVKNNDVHVKAPSVGEFCIGETNHKIGACECWQ